MTAHTPLLRGATFPCISGAGVRRYFNAAADNLARSGFADGCPVGTVALETANASERIRGVCLDVFATWEQVIADALANSGIPPTGQSTWRPNSCSPWRAPSS